MDEKIKKELEKIKKEKQELFKQILNTPQINNFFINLIK